ncbi:hypothetical protein RJ640_024230 [Escallonia rubra]|uniref:Pentatricopeptide repeat-containing protein n=1 Tax=Escallonia rubra TaxID=112253 RepID=A0AA88U560_9ASTE|nr:hypothetical protein RJ640_024230 [Escallonia rubra]
MTAIFLQEWIVRKPSNTIWLHSRAFSCQIFKQPTKRRSFARGPRVLDIVAPKANVTDNRQGHLRLVQDFLQTHSQQFIKKPVSNDKANSSKSDHSVRLRSDPYVLSHALSLCGSAGHLKMGILIHCLAIRTGFMANVFIGSSLIALYGKCGEVDHAYKMFEEMPVRNVVSWTAIINGFALEYQVDVCLNLFRRMRNSALKPNDFTLASFLSVCSGSGALGEGRYAHCQTIRMGFESHVHVANALVSMYCKCGNVDNAWYIFENLRDKDVISWNSMIAGYAQHGLTVQAIDLFETMKRESVTPDAITFLGVLSSCCHAGLVEDGQFYFNSMAAYGVKPELDHYSCIVDLLGRAGLIDDARDFIKKMPIDPNAIMWGSLLSSCRRHGNVWVGIEAAENRLLLKPWCASTHLQLANLYASAGCWDQAAKARKSIKDMGLKTDPGCSWIEVRGGVYRFTAEDRSSANIDDILVMVDGLVDHMRGLGYIPGMHEEVNFDL